MRVGQGTNTYRWVGDWAELPDTESVHKGWAHHGVVVTESGDVVTFHPGESTIMVLDSTGSVKRTWELPVSDAHGITLVKDGATEYLWIADNGRKRQFQIGYEYPPSTGPYSGQVIKTTLDGEVVAALPKPDLPIYRDGNYAPTFVAVNEERHGGNGDIWVTDGYGESHIHRFSKAGNYLSSINGDEGSAGRFNCPHGIFIDRRKGDGELYVADRTNHRVQVYDLEGRFKRVFGSEFLSSPSGFVTHGDLMVVAELRARLAVLDKEDNLLCYLGNNEQVCLVDGWPNNRTDRGELVPSALLEPGKFNSPHGMAVDAQGNLYVAEWLIGDRVIKLEK
jgi:DNA-binding beta-propeller fold protein YncE